MIMNDEYMILKQMAVSCLKVLSRHSSAETKELRLSLCNDALWSIQFV